MSQNGVLVTPIQENKSLLNSLFKFRPTSKLLDYVREKSRVNKSVFSLAEVLTVLKNVIRGEGQFDEKNPSVIICSKELEEAINMKALHVTEIRDLVLSHLIKIQDEEFLKKFTASQLASSPVNIITPTPVNPAQRLVHSANISTQVVTDKQAKFTVRPKFLEVIRSVPNVDQKKTVFTYEEVTLLLSTYILSNKKKFFDTRNIKLAMVEDDPLGEAFNVKAFHRCQVNSLLRGQLIPVEPDYVDTAVVTTLSSPGCGANIIERPVSIVSDKGPAPVPDNLMGSAAGMPPLPAFPALVKAQTLPASNSLVRKRSDSGCEEESKRARLNDLKNRSQSDNDETETETIYSCQGHDTVTVNDDTEESEAETDDDYDVNEYEPETGDEAERPPQAMGKGDHSSCDDSESDLEKSDVEDRLRNWTRHKKSVLKKIGEEQKKESVYDGDNSEDEKDLDSYDSELETADIWKCLTCKTPNKPYMRYCAACWEIRRGWLDYDRKKKRKGSVKPISSPESDTETDGTGDSGDTDRPRMDSQDSGLGESQEIEFTTDKGKPAFNRSVSLDMSASSSPAPSLGSADSGYISTGSSSTASHLCLICCTRPKNASLVHGRIGHQVCCYPCAKKLWKKRSDCPVCRRTVERIIKIIQA